MTWSDRDLYESDPTEGGEGDDEFFDCGMTTDGQCMDAGTEQCDWECPIMANIRRTELRRKEKAK